MYPVCSGCFLGSGLAFGEVGIIVCPNQVGKLNARDRVWGKDGSSEQLSFADRPSWGGPRARSGRPRGTGRTSVRHRARADHRWYRPVHVTLRRAKSLPSLRSELLHAELREAVRQTRREDFRIVQYSVQNDHVHMLVEADDSAALSAGMKSFAVRAARRLNTRVLRRRGSVWAERYHRRDLVSPRDVRNAVVYVINNHLKHHEWDAGLVDPCSSAPWFSGWMHGPSPPPEPSPVERARTWLLDRGWHDDIRFVHQGELPSALREPTRLRD
jgi:REP element-mobilizing transposase RayT